MPVPSGPTLDEDTLAIQAPAMHGQSGITVGHTGPPVDVRAQKPHPNRSPPTITTRAACHDPTVTNVHGRVQLAPGQRITSAKLVEPGAVIHDTRTIAARTVQGVTESYLEAIDGSRVQVHAD